MVKTDVAAPKLGHYYPVSERLAKDSNRVNSFYDYKDGSATAGYRAEVDKAAEKVLKHKKEVDPIYHEKIDSMFEAYCKRLAEWIDKQNSIDASYPSVMIAGASGFNTRRKNKQNDRRDSHWKYYEANVEGFLDKILSTGTSGISSDDKDAVKKLNLKIQNLEKLHETMKKANAYFRKHQTMTGFPDLSESTNSKINAEILKEGGVPFEPYKLALNTANIRRMKDRVKYLEKVASTEFKGWKFNGGEILFDKEDNRLRVLFDTKPDLAKRTELKKHGFRWSPKNTAWQRQITNNAIYSAKHLFPPIK